MESTKNVLNGNGGPYHRSVSDNDFLYPVFVIPVDFDAIKDFVEPVNHDRFPYFPFQDVSREGSGPDASLLLTFNTQPGSGPANPRSLYTVRVPVTDMLLAMSSMGFSPTQVPFAFVDSSRFREDRERVDLEDIEFIAGPPMLTSDEMGVFKEKLEKSLEAGVLVGREEEDEQTATFSLLWLEALSRAFAYTYSIGQQNVSTLDYLISREGFINESAEIVEDPSTKPDVYTDAYIFSKLPEILAQTYRTTMDHAPSDPDLPEEDLGADFENIMSEEDDLARDLMGVVDVTDESLPVDLRRMKLIRTWEESPLDSDLPGMAAIREELLKVDTDGTYREILDIDLGHPDTFDHALEHYGPGKIVVALSVLIAEKALKLATFSETEDEFTPEHDVMFNMKEWFNLTGHDISWEWLALVEPLQNYDVSLSQEFMLFEPRAFHGVELPENAVILPSHMITMLKTAIASTLALPMWEGYDFTKFKEDANLLGVNIDGFTEFVDWFDHILRAAHKMYADSGDVNEVMTEIVPAVLTEGMENLSDLGWKVSMTLPVLSEVCPATSRHEVGSEKWVQNRKLFIVNHLTTMLQGL